MLKLSLVSAALASKVVDITGTENFETFLGENKHVLVKFFAPWCGHCKKMKPEFENASTEIEKAALADVDCTSDGGKPVCEKYGVSGYPTVKWFTQGADPVDFDGARDKAGIVSWIDMMTGVAVEEVADASAIKEAESTPTIVLHGAELIEAYKTFAEGNRKAAKFFHLKNSDAAKVTLGHKGEDKVELTEVTEEKLKALLTENSLPMVGVLDGNTFGTYSKSGKGIIWSLFPMAEGDKLADVADKNRPLMMEVAKALKGRYLVTYTDTKEFGDAIEGMLGVTSFPAFVIQPEAGGKKKFEVEGEHTAANIVQHVEDVIAGKLVAKLKSEPVPEEQGDVKVVVGTTLKEMVFSATKDVLFEVYAPWCGHCKQLDPHYVKLGKKVVSDIDEYVTIAKMDGTANDSPVDSITWSGFPTIVFIKAGSEEVKSYDGGRTAEDMWKWIKENSSHKDAIQKALESKHGADASKHDEL